MLSSSSSVRVAPESGSVTSALTHSLIACGFFVQIMLRLVRQGASLGAVAAAAATATASATLVASTAPARRSHRSSPQVHERQRCGQE